MANPEFNKVAIVYENLPPETRKLQAKKFNDPDNDIQFLVTTDAVGMGLNFNIRRIIFFQLTKNDKIRQRYLTPFEIKQIAGRAGRFKEPGYVTCLHYDDFELIKEAIQDID